VKESGSCVLLDKEIGDVGFTCRTPQRLVDVLRESREKNFFLAWEASFS
jgi:hypothetical protein